MFKLPDGRFTVSTKIGKAVLGLSFELKNVLFVDGLHCHLISVSQLTKETRCIFQITDRLCIIQDRITAMLIGAGKEENGLYFFKEMHTFPSVQHVSSPAIDVWHCRLGHPSSQVLESLKLSALGSSSVIDNKACDACIRAKHTHDPFPLSTNKTKMVFELVHCDLWGPYRTPALCGSKYFLTILDDYSRALWIYLLPSKHSAPTQLKNFIALVERQFSRQVKTIRSDNGTEFTCLSEFFRQHGIMHETSCVGTPQQNGRVKRKHHHILNVERSLLFQANLPIEFWGYCALTAGYLINRTPSKVLNGKSPFEILYNNSPPLQHLHVFGCLCYVHNQKHGGDKFASRSNRSIFLGYPHGKKGWCVYNMDTGVVSISRDVIFRETEFPYAEDEVASPSPSSDSPLQVLTTPQDQVVQTEDSNSDEVVQVTEVASETTQAPNPPVSNPIDHLETDNTLSQSLPESTNNEPATPSSTTEEQVVVSEALEELEVSSEEIEELPQPELLGRGHRQRRAPTKLADYVTTLLHSPSPSSKPYPLDNYISSARFSKNYQTYILAITTNIEPTSFKQAMEDENWRLSLDDEIIALDANGTWTVEELPPGKVALG